MRDILFKYLHNLLGLNSRIAHFVYFIDESCAICKLEGILPVQQETFLHLFYECSYTKVIHSKAMECFFPEIILANDNIGKLFWLCGTTVDRPNMNNNVFLRAAIGSIQNYIWECKFLCKFSQLFVSFLREKLNFFLRKYKNENFRFKPNLLCSQL
jgi:hypothetical protein